MRIGLDLDGVVCDSVPKWREVFARELGLVYSQRELPDTYGTPEHAACTDRHELECLLAPHPVAGAVAALHSLRAAGHELVVVTARSPRVARLTAAWFDYHGLLAPDRMHFLEGGRKDTVARAEALDVFVEDIPGYAQALAGAGVPVLLFAWPYNAGCHHPLVRRVGGWAAVLAAIGGMDRQARTGA